MKPEDTKENAPAAPPPLYSIGYGSRTLAEFVGLLQTHQIEYLFDVRTAPYSKFKPDFSKEPLERALTDHGLHYVYLGDLLGGQPTDPDCYLDGKVDYSKVAARPGFQTGIERLKAAHAQQLRAALMCSEGRPEECHRSKLIGEALTAQGIPIAHIDEDGRLRSQFEVIRRLTGGQLDLFGQPVFTSRKRYPPGRGPDPEHPR
jgi:uncharacterized protein (DUF488 family)